MRETKTKKEVMRVDAMFGKDEDEKDEWMKVRMCKHSWYTSNKRKEIDGGGGVQPRNKI
jgi:hypothetical protein